MTAAPPDPTAPAARLALTAVALLGLATWALSHGYAGLFHDAGLYTLQALSHLHPATLRADVFLQLGSQDQFTIWSPIYAWACRLWGVEPAAAVLTLAMQAGLLASAAWLAWTAVGRTWGVAGLAVLIAIPGVYGASRIFTCIEAFVTPRMAAEALVLCGLAAALRQRPAPAVVWVVAAALLHPLMAMAGVCALYWLYVGEPRPVVAVALAVVGLKALALAAFAMPPGLWGRFDPSWLTLVADRSPYLFAARWQLEDWAPPAVTMATLLLGRSVLAAPAARRLATLALLTGGCGLVLTLIACDVLHLVLITQLQPWRWQWLTTVTAALLLPATVVTLWRRETAGSSAALLLVAAWLFAPTANALVVAGAAALAAVLQSRLKPNEARWVVRGSVALLAVAVVWRVASNLEFTDAYYLEPSLPGWWRRLSSFTRDGAAPAALMLLAWGLAHTRRGGLALWLLVLLGAGLCAAASPQVWRNWTQREFTPQRVGQFAAWRRALPLQAQVFWPESPLGVWVLLDRPSYVSVLQTSGLVFSRAAALALAHRARSLGAGMDPGAFLDWHAAGATFSSDATRLRRACDGGAFDYWVSAADFSAQLEVVAPPVPSGAAGQLWLYRCRPANSPRDAQARAAAST